MHQFPLLQGPDSDYPDLDPHGAAVQLGTSDGDLLLTSDFINPLSTVTANVFTYPIGAAPAPHYRESQPLAPASCVSCAAGRLLACEFTCWALDVSWGCSPHRLADSYLMCIASPAPVQK